MHLKDPAWSKGMPRLTRRFGGSLGVAGGYSNARSSAEQSGARNISQFFAEKLRQALMQNAESYRELNASVVTTATKGRTPLLAS